MFSFLFTNRHYYYEAFVVSLSCTLCNSIQHSSTVLSNTFNPFCDGIENNTICICLFQTIITAVRKAIDIHERVFSRIIFHWFWLNHSKWYKLFGFFVSQKYFINHLMWFTICVSGNKHSFTTETMHCKIKNVSAL